ncbi:MAG: glycine--tRNA ligase subunit beta [Proteobacteria bacterium]|nr:glycine--tRNA ligase subunit beta [Pseudomonadota bacterium]
MPELLLELLSEEIPARMQARAAEDLKRLVCDGLKKAGLKFSGAQAFVTPRRLALVVNGIPGSTPDISEERRGPSTTAPDKAVGGFKGSLPAGAKIEKRETEKGEFYFALVEQKGGQTNKLLPELFNDVFQSLPWPKSMRWGNNKQRWVRPLHSLLCVFDGKIVDDVAFGDEPASNMSSGHRFFFSGPIKNVKNFADYKAKLEKAHVILDAAERRDRIEAEAGKLAKAAKLSLKDDPGLLAEVAGLVEWPVVLMGAIDKEYMDLPDEVLGTSMRQHQKYFALLDGKGKLAPRFIVVANTETSDNGKAVIAGNERVLRARLSDAKFFWDQDLKQRLDSRVQALGGRVFHAKLGTVLDKALRIEELAGAVAEYCGADVTDAKRAAWLAKADLSTGMVTEFPDLQGVMGRYYALADGEKPAVAAAIAEHYSPRGPGDACPSAPLSVAVAMADKIDTLVGFWAIDEKPTGSKDPFALRRAALGVIRLIIENGLRAPLLEVFESAHDDFEGHCDTADLLAFFADRLKVHLKEKDVPHDHIDAVFSLGGEDDLVRLLARVEALGAFLNTGDGKNLIVAYKRAANILRKEEEKDKRKYEYQGTPLDFINEPAEIILYDKLMEVGHQIRKASKEEKYSESMRLLASIRSHVDVFFDQVMINVDDPDLRENRLEMLDFIRSCVHDVADFSKIEGGDK